MNGDWLVQPVVQYGFLGFSAVLLGVVVWLITKLLNVLDANNKIVGANTKALCELTKISTELLQSNRELHDKIITRPCLALREGPME